MTGSDQSVVTRISAATNEIVDKIHVGIDPGAIVATPQEVWVAHTGDNSVQRIDPSSGKAGQPILVGDGPAGLALDGTTLWIANSRSASVTQLDTRAGEAAAADIQVDAGPRGVTLTTSDVWIANELGQSVARIDRSTGRVVSIPVDDGPISIVVADGVAWVNNASSGTISRIDTATNAVTRTNLGSAPRSLTWADGHVWVATGAFGNSEHVGGTLTWTQFQPDQGSLDPTAEGGLARPALLGPVYDGLVGFQKLPAGPRPSSPTWRRPCRDRRTVGGPTSSRSGPTFATPPEPQSAPPTSLSGCVERYPTRRVSRETSAQSWGRRPASTIRASLTFAT